eukprot:scaffold77519_cov18-Tisochrysis_lutea.AAC.1
MHPAPLLESLNCFLSGVSLIVHALIVHARPQGQSYFQEVAMEHLLHHVKSHYDSKPRHDTITTSRSMTTSHIMTRHDTITRSHTRTTSHTRAP